MDALGGSGSGVARVGIVSVAELAQSAATRPAGTTDGSRGVKGGGVGARSFSK